MFKFLVFGILVVMVKGDQYETLQNNLDSLDLNLEVQSFLRDDDYYSIYCGNGYSRHYHAKPLDEEYLCWSSVEGKVLEVLRESNHLTSGQRNVVSWQYQLTPTYWTFTGERRWCVAKCSAQETTEDIGYPHPPLRPASSDDLSKTIYFNELLPYNLLVGPADDIVSLNKSELLRQNPLLFATSASTRKPHSLAKRGIYDAMKNKNSLMVKTRETTAYLRERFLRLMPRIKCPPGCVPLENDFLTTPGYRPSVYIPSKPGQPPYSKNIPGKNSGIPFPSPGYILPPGYPGLGKTPSGPGNFLPNTGASFGPGHYPPNIGASSFGPGYPGQGYPPLGPGYFPPNTGASSFGPGYPGLGHPPLGPGFYPPNIGASSFGPGHPGQGYPPLGPGSVPPNSGASFGPGKPGQGYPSLGPGHYPPNIGASSFGPGLPGLGYPPSGPANFPGQGHPGQGHPPLGQGYFPPNTGASSFGPGHPGHGYPPSGPGYFPPNTGASSFGPGHPGQGYPPLGPGYYPPNTGASSFGPGYPGLGHPGLGHPGLGHPGLGHPPKHSTIGPGHPYPPVNPPGLGSPEKLPKLGAPPNPKGPGEGGSIEVHGTSPPQHMFLVIRKIIEYIKSLFS